ncbi:MAG: hypothetical protein LBH01_06490 [Verrucomicrobiales bacterium]|jgi:hypothetical protein|nr:hypothetical protein [Verrucomicrobiales bacterium]
MKQIKKFKGLIFAGVAVGVLWMAAVVSYASQSQSDQISGKQEWKQLQDATCSSGSSSNGG